MKQIILTAASVAAALTVVPFAGAAHAQSAPQTQQDNRQALLSYQPLVTAQSLVPAGQDATPQNPRSPITQLQAEPAQGGGSRKSRAQKKTALKRVLVAMQNSEAQARAAGVPDSEGEGITLVASSSVADAPVTPLTETTTASNVEAQLDKLVKELPHGTRWVKLMLPPTPPNKTLHGDDVADYALAQARMYGSVGEAVLPKGSVEVISQPLGSDKAKVVVPALRLRPVYVLLNPDTHIALRRVGGGGNEEPGTPIFFNLSLSEGTRATEEINTAVGWITTKPAPASAP